MDKSLHILQKSADGVPTGISLDMSLEVDGGAGFAEQQMVGLSDKIPLLKPHFKKKQRKLEAKCLQQALEDPILSTLLRSDTLVSGDGVFVPRRRPGRTPGTLCAAAVTKQTRLGQVSADQDASEAGVAGLVTREGDVEMGDALEESRQQAEPKVGDPLPEARCAVLRPAGNKAAASPGSDVPPVVAAQTPRQEAGVGNDNNLLTSAAGSLPLKDGGGGGGVEDCLPLALQPDHGVLFEDKSEEASLDLVFELLTQLQYHTHQSDSVHICLDFLQGRCVYGNDCAQHHTVLPYHWQIRRSGAQTWHSIADESQEQLERLFCNPDNEHATLKFQ